MVRLNEFEYQSSEEELRRVIDRVARTRLGIDGDALISRYRDGKLPAADADRVVDLLALIDLLPGNSVPA
jgi:hypothetical protein